MVASGSVLESDWLRRILISMLERWSQSQNSPSRLNPICLAIIIIGRIFRRRSFYEDARFLQIRTGLIDRSNF